MDWNWDEIQFADNVNIGVFWDKHFRQIKVSVIEISAMTPKNNRLS
jgi:hypothetical protein